MFDLFDKTIYSLSGIHFIFFGQSDYNVYPFYERFQRIKCKLYTNLLNINMILKMDIITGLNVFIIIGFG